MKRITGWRYDTRDGEMVLIIKVEDDEGCKKVYKKDSSEQIDDNVEMLLRMKFFENTSRR